ncbi:hypothetical protein DNTS_005881 [Danionella cerebrum]|uniref:Gastrin-releasing peptide n=1 Tax=Danionella cerebrum TaxID=2873325 RepID=A0A553R8W7_9TELE|nr:hypothetical protein DNTS_005881 [Danionella translucida]
MIGSSTSNNFEISAITGGCRHTTPEADMSVMCLVWRLLVSILVFVVLCDVLAMASDGQPIGKVYPRGNHWAVGHLMGRKSTDEQETRLDEGAVTHTSLHTKLKIERNIWKNLLELLQGSISGNALERMLMERRLRRDENNKDTRDWRRTFTGFQAERRI